MNPFSRFLRQWNEDSDLDQFVEHWDALERLVIRVYKSGEATAADEAEYQALQRWLRANYNSWEEGLRSLWQQALVAGEPAPEDPFRRLLALEGARSFVGNWNAMQTLPAARQSLNQLVLDRSQPD